jgi:hypothetical protein
MGIEIIAAAIMASIALGGVAKGIFKWIARMDRNTEATERLTDSFELFSEKVGDTLTNHEHRITVLETRSEE